MNLIFEVKQLDLFYQKKCVFCKLDFQLLKNKITGIIGPSGCGKSSFLSVLNRLSDLNSDITRKGSVFYNGEDIFSEKYDIRKLRKNVSLIFQEPSPLPVSIFDNIAIGLKEHSFDNIEKRVEHALADVGLLDELDGDIHRSALKLSGGQKQRLCIARSIALEPEVLLLDEPCSSLDPISTEVIESLLLKLKSRFTILIVTHNLAQAKRLCDRVAMFWYNSDWQAGEKLIEGEASEVFSQTENELVNDFLAGIRG
ncbi:MAG: ATP-binding cassette domain-containing protein [Bdellovibrionota bacterium]|nr:ATP-binding cassette domain-containing protein [Bdellovibrionota bacterium]